MKKDLEDLKEERQKSINEENKNILYLESCMVPTLAAIMDDKIMK